MTTFDIISAGETEIGNNVRFGNNVNIKVECKYSILVFAFIAGSPKGPKYSSPLMNFMARK